MDRILEVQTDALSMATTPDFCREKDHQKMSSWLGQILPHAEIHIFGPILPGSVQNDIAPAMRKMISEKVLTRKKAIAAFIVCTGSSAENFASGALWEYIYFPDETTPEKIEEKRLILEKQISKMD